MAEFDVSTVLGQVSGALSSFSQSVKVIGEPIEAAGKLIIPAVVARAGFGAGGGSGTSPEGEGKPPSQGSGGGGGGGVTLTPVFLIVDSEGERILVASHAPGAISSVVEAVKGVVTQFRGKREEKEEGGEA